MSLVLLILQIISAIPTVIKIIKEIMDIIHGLKGEEKKEAEKDLGCILQRHLKGGCQDPAAAHLELQGLAERLRAKYGK